MRRLAWFSFLQVLVWQPASGQQATGAAATAPARPAVVQPGRIGSPASQADPLAPARRTSPPSGRLPEVPALASSPLAQPMSTEEAEPLELLLLDPNLAQAQARQAQLQAAGLRLLRRAVLPGVGGVLSTYRAPDAARYQQFSAPGAAGVPNHRYETLGDPAPVADDGHASVARRLRDHVAWPPEGAACRSTPRIGLIDTPVEPGHAALLGSRIDAVNLLPAGLRAADAEHGTAVASVLVGQRGTPALLPQARLLAVGVFFQREGRVYTTAELLIRALDHLVLARVDVINLSLGGPDNRLLEQVIRRVRQLGVPLVAAAGNGGPQAAPRYPAAYEAVIAVMAVDLADEPDARAPRGEHLDYAAPGVDIPVARLGAGLVYRSGSSYAAPFVTAMLASGLAESQLRAAARDLGAAGHDAVYGWGLARASVPCGPRGS